MKKTRQSQFTSILAASRRTVIKTLFVTAVVASFALPAVPADAAQIAFTPSKIAVAVKPGEQVSLPFNVLWSGGTRSSSAMFSVNLTGGSLDGSWVSGNGQIVVGGPSASRPAALDIAVPAGAAGGNYTGVFGAVGISSNGSVTAGTFAVDVQVEATATCSKVPSITAVMASQDEIQAKNNKPVTLTFTGTVVSPEGCTIDKAWYSLVDEYGELNADDVAIALSDDGSFSVPVTLTAFRKGSDKDGRLYSLTFGAKNEAGEAAPQGTKIVVAHDNSM